MATSTANQGLPYPESTDTPADTPLFIQQLAEAVEKKLVQVFVNTTERDSKLTAPTEGMFCILTGPTPGEIYYRDGAAWVKLFPRPTITYGTDIPSNSSGSDGDVFFQTP